MVLQGRRIYVFGHGVGDSLRLDFTRASTEDTQFRLEMLVLEGLTVVPL